jgi:tripartite-type tricarboxylate transporter receptor subunit TctC
VKADEMKGLVTRRRLLAASAGAAAVLAAPSVLRAQSLAYPSRPIELYVGFAAGGGTDLTARALAIYLEKELGGSVVVVNKPGASGELALAQAARAQPDGHTLAITNMPGLVTLPIERNTQFKLDDLQLLANLVADPSAFSVLASSSIASLADLVAAAKAKPGHLSFGSTGAGTDDHLALVLFEQAARVSLNHVPFRGAGPLGTAILGQHVDVAGLNVGEAVPQAPNLRIIAQAGTVRSRFAPDVPTFREAGFPIEMGSERGLVAPKGLPPAVASKLEDAVAKVFKNPDFVDRVQQQYTEVMYQPADEWRARIAAAEAQFRKLWATKPWSG